MSRHHKPDCECLECLLKKQLILLCDLVEQGNLQILQNRHIVKLLYIIAKEDAPPYLATFKILSKGTPMPTPGPVTLTAVGQTVTAVVANPLDQFGQPFTGEIPAVTFTDDNPAAATADPASGVVTAVANGTANIGGSLTNSLGQVVTGTPLQVIVNIAAPVPVLTSFEIQSA